MGRHDRLYRSNKESYFDAVYGIDRSKKKEGLPEGDLLPEGFDFPDFSPVPEGEDSRRTEHRFKTRIGDIDVEAKITIEIHDDSPGHGYQGRPADFYVETFTSDGKTQLSKYKQFLKTERHNGYSDKDRYWFNWYRRVESDARGNGFGEWSVRVTEEIVRKMAAADKRLSADVVFETSLQSVASLLVDPQWLGQAIDKYESRLSMSQLDKLEQRVRNNKRNLGYRVSSEDTFIALGILSNSFEELDDRKGANVPYNKVFFRKKIDE